MPFITCLSFNGFDAVCIFQVEKSKIAFIGVIVCLPVLNQPIPFPESQLVLPSVLEVPFEDQGISI